MGELPTLKSFLTPEQWLPLLPSPVTEPPSSAPLNPCLLPHHNTNLSTIQLIRMILLLPELRNVLSMGKVLSRYSAVWLVAPGNQEEW